MSLEPIKTTLIFKGMISGFKVMVLIPSSEYGDSISMRPDCSARLSPSQT